MSKHKTILVQDLGLMDYAVSWSEQSLEKEILDTSMIQHNPSNPSLELKSFCAYSCYRFGLLRIMSAAITPGTQPHRVRIQTIIKEPQPLSTTAKGGNNNESNTRQNPIAQKYSIFSRRLQCPNRE